MMTKLFWIGISLTLLIFAINIYTPLVHPFGFEQGLDTVFLVFPTMMSLYAFNKKQEKKEENK